VEPATAAPPWAGEIKSRIRRRYATLAAQQDSPPEGARRMADAGYPGALVERLPPALVARYSGCGFPALGSDLRDVRLAVDIGCGAGADAWWIAGELQAGAVVIATDITGEMLAPLRQACSGERATGRRIAPLLADFEQLPLAAGVADLVIGNAACNLAIDKHAAFREAFRVLKPGGRLVMRDLVRERELPAEVLEDPLADVTSLGGAVPEAMLRAILSDAGFVSVQIEGHRPFSYLVSVRIEARRPS
jgi:arsenite methyltransferase